MNVALVIIQFGSIRLLRNLLSSLERHSDASHISNVVIVDNGNEMRSQQRNALLAEHAMLPIRFVGNKSASFASGANVGIQASCSEIVILCNNDIEWSPQSSIESILEVFAQDLRIGVIGPQLVYPDGSWQRSFGRIPSLREGVRSILMLDSLEMLLERIRFRMGRQRPRQVGYVDGAFMLIRRKCALDTGGFDERFEFYGEDAEFCRRAVRRGWKVMYDPSVRVVHLRGGSSVRVAAQTYAEKLMRAHLELVRQEEAAHRVGVYGHLLELSLRERLIVYSILRTLQRDPKWAARALTTKQRLDGLLKLRPYVASAQR